MFRKIEIKISLLIFFYGLFSNNPFLLYNKEKAILGIFLFAIPLLFQLSKTSKLVKIYAIWFGMFMVLQSLLALLGNPDYKTMHVNLDKKVNIAPNLFAGIDRSTIIQTDSQGFRVTKEINYRKKAKNKYRIFAIGASTTEQSAIDQHQTWTHLLQNRLDNQFHEQDFEVINTGFAGTRTPNHLATLEKIINYHPDMVIFLMGINDWNHQIMAHYNDQMDQESGYSNFIELVNKLSYAQTMGKYISLIKYKIKAAFKINMQKESETTDVCPNCKGFSLLRDDKREFKPDAVSQNYKNDLEKINKICDEHKIKCVFLTQANGYKKTASEEYKKTFWMTPPNVSYTLTFDSLIYIAKLYNDYMKEFAKKNNKIMCDLDAQIPASLDYMYDDCHYNNNGAKRISEVIFNCLENKLDDDAKKN